ncbi:MAG: ATPase [Chloroflexi bacterium]|nr:ATPase [Chloroflexota bacterium]
MNNTIGKEVVVTGDVTMDWNLARFRSARNDTPLRAWWAGDRTKACWHRGGAAMLADLIHVVAKQSGYIVRQMDAPREPMHPGDERFHHSYALWDQFKGGKSQEMAWRVKDHLGLDPSPMAEPASWQKVRNDPSDPMLVVLDDADLGFRHWPELWPRAVAQGNCQGWVLVKMARPVARGPLWEHLHKTCAQRLIMVMTIDDLRLTQVQISRELSWERTAQDLFWELTNNPHVSDLSDCAHVVISFDTAGALLLSCQQGELECTLFFDPRFTEGGWNLQYPGRVVGYTTCLTAAIAWQILRNPAQPDLTQGIQNGVAAMRLLHQGGYLGPGSARDACRLAFPIDAVAARLMDGEEEPLLASVRVPNPISFLVEKRGSGTGLVTPFWTILQERYPENLDEVARKVVEEGVEAALQGVPLGQFGKLLTLDRREIESYRSIRAVLAEYCSRPQKRPISIAVFGPPGSGKSFGVEQVARSIRPDDPQAIEVRTFNLSQFRTPDELIGALHQVRDLGLSGKMPLVFWDEFDSQLDGQALGWLRYFLSPMQDGSFQEGQVTHPIGQAIFVFAGGTSTSMEEFAQVAMRAKDAKGPDFLSRLKGYVNIMGPNPLDVKYPAGDPYFLIRRAILLRSLFALNAHYLFTEPNGKGKLNIDPGVLRAFLHISSYKHGVRSMESIIAMSMLAGKSRFERSCLPSEAQLNLHVNGLEFLALVQQPELSGELLERLAAAVHEVYSASQEGKPGAPEAASMPYEQLPQHLKQQNRDNVLDIMRKLAFIGCVMIPVRGSMATFAFSEADLEKLAEMEHERWLRAKIAAGWRYGPQRNDAEKINPAILPWRRLSAAERAALEPAVAVAIGDEPLPEDEKEKDRALVRAIPEIVARAGYAIVKLQGEVAKW